MSEGGTGDSLSKCQLMLLFCLHLAKSKPGRFATSVTERGQYLCGSIRVGRRNVRSVREKAAGGTPRVEQTRKSVKKSGAFPEQKSVLDWPRQPY